MFAAEGESNNGMNLTRISVPLIGGEACGQVIPGVGLLRIFE